MLSNYHERIRQTCLYILGSLASVLVAFVITAIFLLLVGRDPIAVYCGIYQGAFGDTFSFSETLVAATPIMLCGLGVAVAQWLGMMNVGAEGQLYLGAIGATYVALNCHLTQSWQLLPLMLIAAAVCGGLWSFIPALLRVTIGVSEVIVTLLMNYIALLLVEFLIHGPWEDPNNVSWPQTAAFPPGAELPHFFGTRVHLGIVFGVLLALLFAILLPITKIGFISRVIGSNPIAAQYAHYKVKRYQLWAMIISGAIAALAGFSQVSAIEGRLRSGLSPGYGYTGFLACWLARHNPVAIIIVSILIGGLLSGADSLQLSAKLPFATVNILQGTIFFCLLAFEQFIGKLVKKNSARSKDSTEKSKRVERDGEACGMSGGGAE
jgi:general nucleoside transport system permease protein